MTATIPTIVGACRISAQVQMPCEPRTLTDCRRVEFVAECAQFQRELTEDGRDFARIIAFGVTTTPGLGYQGTDRTNVTVWYGYEDEPVPDWLPTPPDGWDLGVTIEIERRAILAVGGVGMTLHLLPHIDDADVRDEHPEDRYSCDRCADQGCAACDPDLAMANHTAWALDLLAGA